MDNTTDPGLTTIIENIVGQLAPGIAGAGKGTITEQVTNSILQPGMQNLLNGQNPASGAPKAYLNWILFDEERFTAVSSGIVPVPQITGSQQKVLLQANGGNDIEMTKNGYLYVYVSNESRGNVYFDDIRVEHKQGSLIEETHYYPFGLTMAGISSRVLNSNYSENKSKYNGIEQNEDFDLNMYDAFYRNFDPQIGRWWQIDPKPNDKESPYAAMANNPVLYSDFLGDTLNIQDLKRAATATRQLEKMVNDGLGGFYKFSVNANGNTDLVKTDKKGSLAKEQKELYNIMHDLVKGNGQTQVTVVEGSENVLIGSFEMQQIDVTDIKNGANNVVTASALVAHELVEQKAQQVEAKDYTDAHKKGITAENKVSGAIRGDLLPSPKVNIDNMGNINGAVNMQYTRNGTKYVYTNNIVNNNVISNTITLQQPTTIKKKP
jgi:RHS repeat-associated protein